MQFFGAAESLSEQGTREPALALVGHVVAEFVIGEDGVQAGDGAGDVVIAGDGTAHHGVQHTVLFFDLYVRSLYVVQKGG